MGVVSSLLLPTHAFHVIMIRVNPNICFTWSCGCVTTSSCEALLRVNCIMIAPSMGDFHRRMLQKVVMCI
jgi:hypothetical protein